METSTARDKRVIIVFWKKRVESPFEVFSNLKNFCLSYIEFNYNTLNNYLGKAKVPYENEDVRIERKSIISKPKAIYPKVRAIVPVIRKVQMKEADDAEHDLEYWLGKSAQERAAAVTFIISQSLAKGQRMDKTRLSRKIMHS